MFTTPSWQRRIGPAADFVLQVESVEQAHDHVQVLRGIRLGEVVGLVGDNGAGEGTLIQVLLGAMRADAGGIRVSGQEVSTRSVMPAATASEPSFRTWRCHIPFRNLCGGQRQVVAIARLIPWSSLIVLMDGPPRHSGCSKSTKSYRIATLGPDALFAPDVHTQRPPARRLGPDGVMRQLPHRIHRRDPGHRTSFRFGRCHPDRPSPAHL